MTTIIPTNKPQLKKEDVAKLLSSFSLDQYPVKLLGIRGYYKQTMGNPVTNDYGIYDDAVFIASEDHFSSYNFNTDPSRAIQGVAVLKCGGPYLYKLGLHGIHHLNLNLKEDKEIYDQLIATKRDVVIPGRILPYWALRQYSNVTVLRDGIEHTDDPNNRFYIDIHKGGYGTTSSLGCQTVYPDQWESFYATVKILMKISKQEIIPYCLVEY